MARAVVGLPYRSGRHRTRRGRNRFGHSRRLDRRYFGFLVGPPTIGFLAEWTRLGVALFLVVLLSLSVAALAGAVGRGAKGVLPMMGDRQVLAEFLAVAVFAWDGSRLRKASREPKKARGGAVLINLARSGWMP